MPPTYITIKSFKVSIFLNENKENFRFAANEITSLKPACPDVEY